MTVHEDPGPHPATPPAQAGKAPTPHATTPPAQAEVDRYVVGELLRSQHPDLSRLTIRHAANRPPHTRTGLRGDIELAANRIENAQ